MSARDLVKIAIYCIRRTHQQKIVETLEKLGFTGPKSFLNQMVDLEEFLGPESGIEILVCEIADFRDEEKRPILARMKDLVERSKELDSLVYCSEPNQGIPIEWQRDYSSLNMHVLPISRDHFIGAFGRHLGDLVKAQADENHKVLMEALGHIKASLADLKFITRDREAFSSLARVGQRFNGVYGTFTFFSKKDGYVQLLALAKIIDSVAKSYESNPELKEIKDEHLNLVVRSAKASFQILTGLLNGERVAEDLNRETALLKKNQESMSDLFHHSENNQEFADQLIDNIKKVS